MTHGTISIFFNKHKYAFILILLLVFLSSIQSFMYPMLQGQDFKYHYNRFYTLCESIVDGTFPNYMDYYIIGGYGYLVKNFYSNFLLIPFAELSRLISIKQSYNLVLLSSTFFCGLASYFSFKGVTKNKFGAIIFTLLYTTSSYRFICLYERSALGEALAIIFIPLIFWGIHEIINGDYKKFYILSIGLSLIIYSHAITSVLSVLACSIYLLFNIKQIITFPIRVKYLMYSAFLCIILSLYYILPYFEMLSFDNYQFSKNNNDILTEMVRSVVCGIFKLYDNQTDNYRPKIGLLIAIPAIFLRFFVTRKKSIIRTTDIFLVCGIFLVFACTHYFPWNTFLIKHLSIIQFSYRLYTIITFLFTYCTAVYCSVIFKKNSQKIIIFIIFLVLIMISLFQDSLRYKNQAQFYFPGEINVTTTNEGISGGEFLPASFTGSPQNFTKETENRGVFTIEKYNSDSKIENLSKNKGRLIFDLQLTKPDTLILPLTYYKGYKITINNQDIRYFSTNGLITINPSVSGKIETQYIGTGIIKVSLIISVSVYFLLGLFILWKFKRNKGKRLF